MSLTQIISVITKEYALLASDRRLTYADGPRRGELFNDDTCKLISVCNFCGIGYSGLAKIEGCPTHEWVAKTLASANCSSPKDVSGILTERAGPALSMVRSSIRHQIFLMAGWWYFDVPPGLRSHFCIITNALDESGNMLVEPRESFDCRVRALRDEEEFLWHCVGQPIRQDRAKNLERNLRRLIAREIGPKETLRLLVDEIINTSTKEKCASVGSKVLGFRFRNGVSSVSFRRAA